ncbi:MAG: hypothetical protein E7Z87_03340 [Cyanobacteria bacterium SIG26]|nr:hypothetical protein [Cyanobacteria bacterium SIG26]
MALNNMSDGVGRKIVEALKMHDNEFSQDSFSQDVELNDVNDTFVETVPPDDLEIAEDIFAETEQIYEQDSLHTQDINTTQMPSFVDVAFQQSLANNLGITPQITEDFEYPTNVAVLKQLISKLPAGVSKQTGALIIKQTMEALGISMNNVLQEAKQVQETLITSAKECQNNIIDYKKQISILEIKAQQYQKQSIAMNDIINLFIQTGIR